MPHPKIKISDDSGNTVDVTDNALKVTLSDSENIDIGNVVLTNTAGVDIKVIQAETDSVPDLDQSYLLGTHALLSARKDAGTTIGITCEDGTHNALHVAISDGAEIALVDATGALHTTHGITGMVSDRNTNISDSTAEQLNSATDGSYDEACKRVDLQASLSNTGYILVGDSGIVANLSGGGIKLNPGDFYSMDVNNVGDIYVLAETDTEDIFYTYFT